MKMKHGWAAATLAVAVLSAAPGQAQGHSCDNGRGGLMTDLGFNNLRRGVRGNGPAAGRFRDGDVLAAVDEERITTHEGARRYSEIRGGEQMRLAVRRDGQVQEVTITAGARCIPHPPSPRSRLRRPCRRFLRPMSSCPKAGSDSPYSARTAGMTRAPARSASVSPLWWQTWSRTRRRRAPDYARATG